MPATMPVPAARRVPQPGPPDRPAAPVAPPPSATARPQNSTRRWIKRAFFTTYLLVLLEVGSRLYWTIGFGVPLLGTNHLEVAYFSSLRETGLLQRSITREDGTFDVLLLGGSVVHPRFGDVATGVRRELEQFTPLPVRVHNLGESGHTTRDSLLKYRSLDRQRFDLVIVYHGINDSRQNNCPAERFRDDYSHCGWYRRLALIERHPERAWLTLPYTLECLAVSVMESPSLGRYLPRDTPRGGWGADSEVIKTAGPFRRNLEEIAGMAESRGDPLVLMTFAHLGEHYQPYAHIDTGINAWGTAPGVLAALNAHNEAIRAVVAEHPTALFVDQAASMPKNFRYFVDPCHLTCQGTRVWASNLREAMRERVAGDWPSALSQRTSDSPDNPDHLAEK